MKAAAVRAATLLGVLALVGLLPRLSGEDPALRVLRARSAEQGGKSTTAAAALGLLRPDAGSVRFDGVEPTALREQEIRPLRRRFQPVFQDPHGALSPGAGSASSSPSRCGCTGCGRHRTGPPGSPSSSDSWAWTRRSGSGSRGTARCRGAAGRGVGSWHVQDRD